MQESRRHSERDPEPFQPGAFTRGLGYLCVVIGIVMGACLFFKVWGIIDEPAAFQAYEQLITESLEAAVNSAGGEGTVTIPFEPIGYLLLVIIIGILIRIATMFLSSGAKLVSCGNEITLKKMSKAQTPTNSTTAPTQASPRNSGGV